jgi:hypothetical protein
MCVLSWNDPGNDPENPMPAFGPHKVHGKGVFGMPKMQSH